MTAVDPETGKPKDTSKNLKSIRPGDGLHPKFIDKFINKISNQDIEKGTPLDWSMLEV